MAGYSQTPLVKKLGIKDGFKVLWHNAPTLYKQLISPHPNIHELSDWQPDTADFIHAFFKETAELASMAPKLKAALKKTGILWISWPKKTSELYRDLDRETVREIVLACGLVDIKVAAIDENWSGLKFMYRKKDR